MLLFTTALFPFLFLTLELPKRIINDAIGAQTSQVTLFGQTISQLGLLALLCAAFLGAVLVHGLLKMRINTMKGILAERMLRRLRYGLISRMLRFPKAYFRRTSQGELVAMITGETEPMGGMMGDALTQPVLQAGQMITILVFLFLQNVWFGLAAVALIPLQAWLIPRLQRQINLMNKKRIKQLRQLAAQIGESAAGASELRIHGGWRHRLSEITHRLGLIYGIRLRIYQKKFFMKFLNNFITQLTPFFFFAIGGYLVIQGAVSLGALVAALAAYKDLSSPWKELLAFYNQAQDMGLRWETVTERFAPSGVIDTALMMNSPRDLPRLTGPVVLDQVSVADSDGNPVLENISARFDPGTVFAIHATSAEDRQAICDVLTREVLPVYGTVTFGAHALGELHQSVIAARIGHANGTPVLFQGRFEDNAMMALKPHPVEALPEAFALEARENARAGNSADPLMVDWLKPDLAGLEGKDDLRTWWHALLDSTGSGDALFWRALEQKIDGAAPADLTEGLLAARPRVWGAIEAAGLAPFVCRFDPERFNPALPVTSNLLFAILRSSLSQKELASQTSLFELTRDIGLEQELLDLSREIIGLLHRIFGTDGTQHPLFRKLGFDPDLFQRSVDLLARDATREMDDADKAVLMSVLALISAEQIGPAFTEELQARILKLRRADRLVEQSDLSELYAPLSSDKIAPGLSVLENVLFGKISDSAGARADEVRKIVSDVVQQLGLRRVVTAQIDDMPLALGGADLPAVLIEPLAVSRAAVKRPDVLILDNVLNGETADHRSRALAALRNLLPEATIVYLGDRFDSFDGFDGHLEIRQGRMVSGDDDVSDADDTAVSADLLRKVRALETAPMFSDLSRKELRLLGFGARWFSASADEIIFHRNDMPTDGVYLILSGTADLFHPEQDGAPVAEVGAGSLVGELGVIRNVPRALTMRARTDVDALRLGADDFLAVIEHDAATAFKLLQVVAGYAT